MSVFLFAIVGLVLFGGAIRPAAADDALPTIADKTKGLVRQDGFVPMYVDAKANKVWLEIANPGHDLLYEVSLPAGLGSTDIGLDRGQIDGGRIVRFERYGSKVLLVQPNESYRGVTADDQERGDIETSFATSALYGFSEELEPAVGLKALDRKRHFLQKTLEKAQRAGRAAPGI